MFSFAASQAPVEYMWMKAHAALTKGDVVWVSADEDGFESAAVASSASVRKAAVAAHDIASGAFGLFVVKGPVVASVTSGVFTAGHGIESDGGNVEDSGAAALDSQTFGKEANTDFAVAMEGDGASTYTSLLICLFGEPYTSST